MQEHIVVVFHRYDRLCRGWREIGDRATNMKTTNPGQECPLLATMSKDPPFVTFQCLKLLQASVPGAALASAISFGVVSFSPSTLRFLYCKTAYPRVGRRMMNPYPARQSRQFRTDFKIQGRKGQPSHLHIIVATVCLLSGTVLSLFLILFCFHVGRI